MRILLVGGLGLIGHHLALALRPDHDVAILDDWRCLKQCYWQPLYRLFVDERLKLLRDAGVHGYTGDCRSLAEVQHVVTDFKPDAIVQLAAIADANEAERYPRLAHEIQILGLLNTLEVSHPKGIHVVYISSSMVYGDFDGEMVTEDSPTRPNGFYGELKKLGERYTQHYAGRYDLPTTIVRPSALYGERCIGGRVAQKFIERALRGDPLEIEGNGRLDFTYVHDLVQGLLQVLLHAGTGDTYNLTFGRSERISNLLPILQSAIPGTQHTSKPADPTKPVRGTLSVEKAKAQLGYAPQWPLARGYKRYVEWYLEQHE